MSYPHFDLVERAYNELLATGQIQKRSSQERVEEDKGLLTRRAGFYSHNERDSTIGILEKKSGNNSQGYSTDILIKKDGTFWDIATDTSGMAKPINGGPSEDTNLIPLWRQPTAELAGLADEPPEPEPEPEPPPVSDDKLDKIIAMNVAILNNMNELLTLQQATYDAVIRFESRFNQVIEDMEATMIKILPEITCKYKPT